MTGGRSLQRQIDQAHQHVRQLRDDLAAAQAAELTAASWVHAGRNDGTLPRFFLLLDDMLSGRTRGVPCDASGTAIDGAAEVWLHRDAEGRPFGAEAGYFGVWRKDDGIWRFSQGRCPLAESPCDRLDSDIDLNSPPEASVNQEYSHTIIANDLAGPMVMTGLPAEMTFDGATGAISGKPLVEGLYPIVVVGYSETNECPIVRRFTLIVHPCDLDGAEIDPGTPPPAAENVPYSHQVTLTGLDEPATISGLPPGMTWDGETGDIGGTVPIGDPITNQGTYLVTVRGFSAPHRCPIIARLAIVVGACDAGVADIWWGEPPQPTPPGQGGPQYWANGDRLTIATPAGDAVFPWAVPIAHFGLAATPALLTILSGFDITYDPETGMLSGMQRCMEIDLDFGGESTEYSCPVRRTLTLSLISPDCGDPPPECPDPTDYTELGASIAWINPDFYPGNATTWNDGFDFSAVVTTTNVTNISVTGHPPGSTVSVGDVLPGTPGVSIDKADAQNEAENGSYNVRIRGEVASGEHEGCYVDFFLTIIVDFP